MRVQSREGQWHDQKGGGGGNASSLVSSADLSKKLFDACNRECVIMNKS